MMTLRSRIRTALGGLAAILIVGSPACSSTTPGQSSHAGRPSAGASITASDLLSAPVPGICTHKAGKLVNGVQIGIPTMHGFTQIAWLHEDVTQKAALTAFGDLDGNGTRDAATVLACTAGGVSWPQVIAFYSPGPILLGWASLSAFNLPGKQPGENDTVHRLTYRDGGVEVQWSTQQSGDPAARSSLDYTGLLRLSGHKTVVSELVATTELQTVSRFQDDLRRNDKADAHKVAAPSVVATASNLFHEFPTALTTAPKCYGMNDLMLRSLKGVYKAPAVGTVLGLGSSPDPGPGAGVELGGGHPGGAGDLIGVGEVLSG